MEEQSLTHIINYEMNFDLPAGISFEELRRQLQVTVTQMIETDFQKLVNLDLQGFNLKPDTFWCII